MDCIFCKIVAWETPSVKIREDDDFIAILDIFPNCEWQTLVISKKHFDSNVFNIDDEHYTQYMLAVKKVIQLLKKWLNVERVAMVMEWMWVNHSHFKLYPMHWVTGEWKEMIWWEKVYFDTYPWYITTEVWAQADTGKLEEIAKKIISNI